MTSLLSNFILLAGIPSVVLPPQRAGMATMAGVQHPSSPPAVQAGSDQADDHTEEDGKIKVLIINFTGIIRIELPN